MSSNPDHAITIHGWQLKRAKLAVLAEREGGVAYSLSLVNYSNTSQSLTCVHAHVGRQGFPLIVTLPWRCIFISSKGCGWCFRYFTCPHLTYCVMDRAVWWVGISHNFNLPWDFEAGNDIMPHLTSLHSYKSVNQYGASIVHYFKTFPEQIVSYRGLEFTTTAFIVIFTVKTGVLPWI